MSEFTLNVEDRKGRPMGTFTIQGDQTLGALKQQFHRKHRKYYPSRQWFTVGAEKRALKDANAKISSLGLQAQDKIVFKDLGPQIGWDTVFYTEYAGPIIVHSLFFWLPSLFYSTPLEKHSFTQIVAYACVVGHYLKREFETKFVHHFSSETMPIFNIFKNSFHYWMLGGAFIAYFVYHPLYTAPFSDTTVMICAALFALFELGNLSAHLTLKNLRPPGTRVRGIPRGGLFELVTCANYTYELAAWLVFAIFTQTVTSWLFFIVSAGQISLWALKKHIALKKEFGAKVPKRKILVPFIW